MRTIVLDLEGTLVSNAVSQFPRPHLREFTDYCLTSYDRVCLMTAVSSERALQVLKLLVDEELISSAFLDKLEVVEWSGQYKDLRLVPNADLNETWIVDDQEPYIHPDQRNNWIHVREYNPSLPDNELQQVMLELNTRSQHH